MKYDKYDGATLVNQIGHEFEYDAFNEQLRIVINFIKSIDSKDSVRAINGIQNINRNIKTKIPRQTSENNKDIEKIDNEALVSEIKEKMQDKYEKNRQKITMTSNEKNIQNNERITVSTSVEREMGA